MAEQIQDPNVKQAYLNRSQAMLHLINPNVAYCLWPRASGKTSGGIGPRIDHLSEVLPRSQILLVSDKFERIHDVLVPGIEQYWNDEIGLVEDWDYVRFKKPPEHFRKPLFPLNKYDHVISFASGVALCGVSLKVSGSANGFNAQALIGDEAKFFNEQKLKTEVLPAIRGGKKRFGELPEFQSKWYFTDKWGENIQWLLNKKKDIEWQKVEDVYALALEEQRLIKEMQQFRSNETIYRYKNRIFEISRLLTAMRKELVYYSDAQPYENLEVLGEKFYRDLKRDLTAYEYEVAIENKDPDRAVTPYYPDLGKHHYYKSSSDCNPNKSLIIALDYQFKITPIVTAQFDRLNGSPYTSLNFIKSLHSLHPDGMEAALKKWCDEFEKHPMKVVYYIFDHTAIGRSPWGKTFKDLVVTYLASRGWAVIETFTGDAPDHDIKYEELKKWFSCTTDGAIKINEITNTYLKKALEKTDVVMVNGKTKKDKSSEKSLTVPPEESTHYPDAFDQIVHGALELGYVPRSEDPGMDISMRN
jgi:hypothetical protein